MTSLIMILCLCEGKNQIQNVCYRHMLRSQKLQCINGMIYWLHLLGAWRTTIKLYRLCEHLILFLSISDNKSDA